VLAAHQRAPHSIIEQQGPGEGPQAPASPAVPAAPSAPLSK
jgi:hypothetical protein